MAHHPSDDDHKSALRDQINENLRLVYNTALNDEVPERFRVLLQQLRDSTVDKAALANGKDSQTPGASGAPSASRPQDGSENEK